MRRLPTLLAALLLPTAQPLPLGVAISTGTLWVSQLPSKAQSAEAVAKIAQSITVSIEGATQGSGVLVKRDGNRYTVLTAWHVVSGQRSGEELDIYTPDGQRHELEQGSIKRIGEVDLAVLTFSSSNSYEVAHIGDIKSVSMGGQLFVAGFPLPTTAVPTRLMRFLKGDVIANASVAIPNGYQLLYSNPTLPGMSGGAVLNAQGQLVGIHASAERADQISESSGKAVATGTNQAVSIAYYRQHLPAASGVASSGQAATADDYLARAKVLLGKKGSEELVIRLASQSLAFKKSAKAYLFRASSKYALGDFQGAIADLNQAIALDPQDGEAYGDRGYIKAESGNFQGAIADYNQAILLDPQNAQAYNDRGVVKLDLGDMQGAIADYNRAIAINPSLHQAYTNRGDAKSKSGDKRGAIADYGQAIAVNPQSANAYNNRGVTRFDLGDMRGAIADFTQAISINPNFSRAYISRGDTKSELGDQYGAIADFDQAIAIDPKNAYSYSTRGIAYENIGNLVAACADWRTAALLGDEEAADWLRKRC